jgi:hypothetical protein
LVEGDPLLCSLRVHQYSARDANPLLSEPQPVVHVRLSRRKIGWRARYAITIQCRAAGAERTTPDTLQQGAVRSTEMQIVQPHDAAIAKRQLVGDCPARAPVDHVDDRVVGPWVERVAQCLRGKTAHAVPRAAEEPTIAGSGEQIDAARGC